MHRSAFLSVPAGRLARAATAVAGLALAVAVIPAGLASAAPAALPAGCTQSGATVTCSYGYTGAEQTFTVPAGITAVQVDAIGAAGGAYSQPGGEGAKVTGTLGGLSGGQVLYVEVGQQPDTASTPEGVEATAFNGGGAPGFGSGSGGGGGASDVRDISRAAAGSLASRLIVAGGGGGHSGIVGIIVPAANAGEDAQPATVTYVAGQGGFAGTQTAGGAGGQSADDCFMTASGSPGSLGQGGNGVEADPSSGGGGGGLYGGGGGGGGSGDACGDEGAAAGGGGGGSSLVPAGGAQTLTGSPASVTISYTVPGGTGPGPAITLSSSASPSVAGHPVTYTATVSPAPDGGTVAFTDNGSPLARCTAVPVAGSTARCATTPRSTGAHNITAAYSRTATSTASTSPTVTQVVTKTPCASLAGCNLSRLNLTGARLAGANLSRANLSKADLTGADLAGATVTRTNFNKVTWSSTTCPDGTSSNNDGGTCAGHL